MLYKGLLRLAFQAEARVSGESPVSPLRATPDNLRGATLAKVGGVAEWFKAFAWKADVRETVP